MDVLLLDVVQSASGASGASGDDGASDTTVLSQAGSATWLQGFWTYMTLTWDMCPPVALLLWSGFVCLTLSMLIFTCRFVNWFREDIGSGSGRSSVVPSSDDGDDVEDAVNDVDEFGSDDEDFASGDEGWASPRLRGKSLGGDNEEEALHEMEPDEVDEEAGGREDVEGATLSPLPSPVALPSPPPRKRRGRKAAEKTESSVTFSNDTPLTEDMVPTLGSSQAAVSSAPEPAPPATSPPSATATAVKPKNAMLAKYFRTAKRRASRSSKSKTA